MEGSTCDVSQPYCEYDQGMCGCLPCEAGTTQSSFWHCRAWNDVADGCPVPRPLTDTTCDQEGLTCDYNQCCGGPSLGYSMRCVGGVWGGYADGACSCTTRTCP